MQPSEKNTDYSVIVVIPAYNSSKYISRAIDSVFAQSRPAEEIIIVDDGSTDNTSQVVQQYKDKVKLIQQSNAGASAARSIIRPSSKTTRGKWPSFSLSIRLVCLFVSTSAVIRLSSIVHWPSISALERTNGSPAPSVATL